MSARTIALWCAVLVAVGVCVSSLAVATPGLVPILFLFCFWWAQPLATWDEELSALLEGAM